MPDEACAGDISLVQKQDLEISCLILQGVDGFSKDNLVLNGVQ